MKVCAVISAYNEESTIGEVVERTMNYVDEVVIVDDGSTDRTAEIAREKGATIVKNKNNIGQLESLKKGMNESRGDIFVNLDGDGEHNPEDIPKFLGKMEEKDTALVLGKRKKIPRPSERWIDFLIRLKTKKFLDSGTGFRAIRGNLAGELQVKGLCPCGVLVLESLKRGAEIEQVPVSINNVKKPRGVAWKHFLQFFLVILRMLNWWE